MEKELSASPSKEKKKYGKFDEWDITSAVDTLIRAEEIKSDKEKMKYVSKCLAEKFKDTKKTITSIQGLREKYKEMQDEENDEY